MNNFKKHIAGLLENAGIALNGSNDWDIEVHDERFFRRVLKERSLGLGESYMDGWWDCRRLDQFFYRILLGKLDEKIFSTLACLILSLPGMINNRQAKSRSRIVADRHYNLDNELFLSFLEPYNQYSCAYFHDTDELEQAQLNKLELVCRKIGITQDDTVLDIGCGWGGFARYACENHGCSLTAVSISGEQVRYARDFCSGLPVTIVERDYRDVRGVFDKIVSIGMFEHVGWKNYRTFMRTAHRCLADKGVFLLQTIANNHSQRFCDPWITRYIFPNGMLPSLARIGKAVEGLFVVEDLHNLGPHYDKTLMAWHRNFQQAWPTLKNRYDEHFKRMWDYYLLSCAGAFRARSLQTWQIVFTKNGTAQPPCRD